MSGNGGSGSDSDDGRGQAPPIGIADDIDFTPETAFAALAGPGGAPFADAVEAAPFPKKILRFRNEPWAHRVGLGALSDAAWIEHFGGFTPLPGAQEAPLALRYHGHQFRSYNPDIGDGRGFLFAQVRDNAGRLLDLGTKGTGRTPYSRFGDGRLTLKGAVRELLATEMLEALGVYTSKTFSIVETGEALERQDEPSPTRSAALVRLSHSHIRFGAFQRLSVEENTDAIADLIAYCAEHFYPHLQGLSTEEMALGFFQAVIGETARLVAQWTAAGFVHGVLNTDNMNVTGESFDYGPWRFAPTFDPGFTAAYFDHSGLYAFGRQAEAGVWNLSRLGGTLIDLVGEEPLNAALRGFGERYEAAMGAAYARRLGLEPFGDRRDFELAGKLASWVHTAQAPFEQVFFDWFCGGESENRREASPLKTWYRSSEFKEIAAAITGRRPARPERLSHIYFQGEKPRTMLIDQVEAIWDPIADRDDWTPLEAALRDIQSMGEAYGDGVNGKPAQAFPPVP
ncbi:MAG: YdiU family protein [Pseudomonadota bacterium]